MLQVVTKTEDETQDTVIVTNILSSYIPDWTVLDAMREIVQNAIDADPGFHIRLNPPLELGGMYSCTVTTNLELPLTSLMMGESSKRDGGEHIGCHGEGLKLAMLVLLRENRQPDIHSSHYIYPKFVPLPSVGRNVLAFNCICSNHFVGGTMIEFDCTAEEFEQFKAMHLEPGTPYGLLSLDKADISSSGKVYVGGLAIQTFGYSYTYNLPPSQIKLERDRKVADSYKLLEAMAEAWLATERYDLIARGLLDGVADFEGFTNIEAPQELLDEVRKLADALDSAPITHSDSYSGYIGTYCPRSFVSVYRQNLGYREPYKTLQPAQILADWFKANKSYFRKQGKARMEALITQSKKWRV